MNIYVLIFGTVIGFLTARFISAKKEGRQGRLKFIKFKIGENVLHIHHWLYGSVVLLVMWQVGFYNDFIYGFFVGMVMQGLMYKDFYYIFFNEKEYGKKYPG